MNYTLKIPIVDDPWHQLAMKALKILLKGVGNNFSDAAHIMPFTKEQGFLGEPPLQYGDIFQRALIADVLIDANIELDGQLTFIIDREIDYLIDRRFKDEAGGWGYFPELPELSPDADDLAQIMQLLCRAKRKDLIDAYCTQPLKVLFESGLHEDGGIETWIIPGYNRTEKQNLQWEWANKAWGLGADVEVMGNLLYALFEYDRIRFAAILEKSARFIVDHQQKEGYWEATWYFGNYYPTYICTRIIHSIFPNHPSSQLACQYILSSWLTDGGWGSNSKFSPLQTAFALLTLPDHLLSDHQYSKVYELFFNTLDINEGWASEPFIRMPMGRPKGQIHTVLEYGSKIITTAIVLKALLKIYNYKTIQK